MDECFWAEEFDGVVGPASACEFLTVLCEFWVLKGWGSWRDCLGCAGEDAAVYCPGGKQCAESFLLCGCGCEMVVSREGGVEFLEDQARVKVY